MNKQIDAPAGGAYNLKTLSQMMKEDPAAFDFPDAAAEVAKKEAQEATALHVMADGGYLRHFWKRGKSYLLVDMTMRQEIEMGKAFAAEEAKPAEERRTDGEMMAALAGLYLHVYDPATNAFRPAISDEAMEGFKLRELSALLREVNEYGAEGEESGNPTP